MSGSINCLLVIAQSTSNEIKSDSCLSLVRVAIGIVNIIVELIVRKTPQGINSNCKHKSAFYIAIAQGTLLLKSGVFHKRQAIYIIEQVQESYRLLRTLFTRSYFYFVLVLFPT